MGTIVLTYKQVLLVADILSRSSWLFYVTQHVFLLSCVTVHGSNSSSRAGMQLWPSLSLAPRTASVKQIDLATFSGNIGILPDHVPLLAVLKPGVIEVIEENDSRKAYFASSGTVTINDDSSVQILCEEACPVENLDSAAAKEGLSKAHAAMAAASTDAERAEAQIAVEAYEALAKAAE